MEQPKRGGSPVNWHWWRQSGDVQGGIGLVWTGREGTDLARHLQDMLLVFNVQILSGQNALLVLVPVLVLGRLVH